tara:strand:- start:134856 stop:135188 length:333 start_codon:yes stop_codon:yes gene_type:complete
MLITKKFNNKDMEFLDYIIDFERVNALTVNEKIDGHVKENAIGHVSFSYLISRRVLKDYVDTYYQITQNSSTKRFKDPEKIKHIIETLVYNKILLTKADIRHKRIDEVLD